MHIRYRCRDPLCRAWNQATVITDTLIPTCATCGKPARIDAVPSLAVAGPITQCVVCGGREFFSRKNFPQRFGLGLVIVFGLIASIYYYFENIPATFATLGSLVVIDGVIYLLVGKVTVCYRCRAEYRGVAYNPEHLGFDLAASEKYDP